MMRQFPPSRIICLSDRRDSRDTVSSRRTGSYRRSLGLCRASGSGAAREAAVSAFISADITKILALEPDLVLTFSDLQASIAADLIRAGIAVHAFNQRDIAGIMAMIRSLGALVGATESDPRCPRKSRPRSEAGCLTASDSAREGHGWPGAPLISVGPRKGEQQSGRK